MTDKLVRLDLERGIGAQVPREDAFIASGLPYAVKLSWIGGPWLLAIGREAADRQGDCQQHAGLAVVFDHTDSF